MRSIRCAVPFALSVALVLAVTLTGAIAQTGFGAQARLISGETRISGDAAALHMSLALGQAVPYRVRVLGEPPRLVVDLNTVDWAEVDLGDMARSVRSVGALRIGYLPDGWARLVIDLAGPFVLSRSEQRVDSVQGTSQIDLELYRVALEEFEQLARNEEQFAARTSA
ncbi:hypothetical protein, partial [Streptomyces murinus]|uniref:hypothetical protein n=1 Tax=Streptomyces murinus TaxID=33900 RepID=UPI0031D338D5